MSWLDSSLATQARAAMAQQCGHGPIPQICHCLWLCSTWHKHAVAGRVQDDAPARHLNGLVPARLRGPRGGAQRLRLTAALRRRGGRWRGRRRLTTSMVENCTCHP